ncbi:MAG: 6-phosphogluconolactonase [Nitrospirae bacterium]|nr:6-phosphogluconolactonase [Nitrospirota bacterium]
MGAAELRILENGEELAREAADFVVWAGEQAIQSAGNFRLALSGGSTPKALYALLAGTGLVKRLDWRRVAVFFGDERCVPPEHADSNFRMANETLIKPLDIPQDRIFRMHGEDEPDQAARRYEESLRKEFGAPAPAWPRFDLILLGLGDDGHTASLFPGTPALSEQKRLVVPNPAPQGAKQRLTFTVPLINQAQTVVFLVSGKSKAPALKAVLEDRTADNAKFPAKLIQPEKGRLIWFLDHAAAAELTVEKQRVVSHEE